MRQPNQAASGARDLPAPPTSQSAKPHGEKHSAIDASSTRRAGCELHCVAGDSKITPHWLRSMHASLGTTSCICITILPLYPESRLLLGDAGLILAAKTKRHFIEFD
jgi:hypothetical protein